MRVSAVELVLLSALLAGGDAVYANESPPGSNEDQWGATHFPVSCRPQVQDRFNRAVAILHSFEYGEAVKAFQDVLSADPDCAMAHWGVAASYARVVWGPAWIDFERGREAIRRALEVQGGTPRERAYIEAVAAFFEESEGLDYQTRVDRFAQRMEAVHRRYPEDQEAALFYAVSLLGTVDPLDTNYAVQRRAGAIAEAVFQEQPDHPGAAHYVIHAYDYPPLASRALPAARRYAEIAPAAAHALHMPSHIFSRLGLWEESLETNRASKQAALKARGWTEMGHTIVYMMYAHLQRAEDRAAARLLDELLALGNDHPDDYGVLEHVADGKARFSIERQGWSAYAALSLDPDLSRFPRFEATVRFARGLGAARSGRPAEARRQVEELSTLHGKLIRADEHYYAGTVAIWQQVLAAWIAHAEGTAEQALELMREAADLDDRTAYVGSFESGPDALVHTREQLGDLLLVLGRPGDALREYEISLETAPNRFNCLYGAGRAAELAGDSETALAYYGKLVKLTQGAESEREPLRRARAFLQAQ